MSGTEAPSPHNAPPFSCPYCGEEELRPDENPEVWLCLSCVRVFLLRLLAVRR
jgi:ribosomal protein L37AE/L43A